MDLKGTQFSDRIKTDTSHPLHHTLHQPTETSETPHPLPHTTRASKTPYQQHQTAQVTQHTYATRSINRLGPNSVLGRIPPNVSDSETELSRADRVHLARLRCGHHNTLMSYRKRLHPEISDTCPLCNISTHTIHHIIEECPSLDQRQQLLNLTFFFCISQIYISVYSKFK